MNEMLTGSSESQQLHRFDPQASPTEALVQYLRDYSRERPEVMAMWCFGIGFVLGWKLKPW